MLRGPETLYDTVTRSAANAVTRALPASKGEVQDSSAKLEAKAEERNAHFEEYKTETTDVINALVGKLNSMTPVSTPLLTSLQMQQGVVTSTR